MTGLYTARQGMILILSGPSGSGKSSIYHESFKTLKDIEFSVSCTTREPRPGERDGVDYHFRTKEQFEELLAQDAFAEHAQVHGNYYGTLKCELERRIANGIDVLLDIDVQGAMQIRELCGQNDLFRRACSFIFVVPPSIEELERRLRGRGTETEESIQRRMRNALRELTYWDKYDYLLENDDLVSAAAKFTGLVEGLRLATGRLISREV